MLMKTVPVPVDQIYVPAQLRRTIDPEKVRRLAEDLLSAGQKTPIQVRRDGERFVHATQDATAFVRKLLNEHGDAVVDLEVRRASLEDAYLELVQRHEAGQTDEAARAFTEVL